MPVAEAWFTREMSQNLVTKTALNFTVTSLKLGVGLLEQWHPPSAISGAVSGKSNEVAILVSNSQLVVNVYCNPLVLNPERVSEHSIWAVILA